MRKRTFTKLRFLARMISLSLVLALLTQDALGSGSITLAAILQEELEVTENTQDTGTEPEEEPADIAEDSEDEEPQILFEVESLREQNGKHYRLSDGTIMAAEYAMDVHYETEDGGWEDIDNRFRYEAAGEADAMEGYATAEGAVEFKFAPDTSGEVVRAASGEYSVGFELLEEKAAERSRAVAREEHTDPASRITFLKGDILNEEEIPEGPVVSLWSHTEAEVPAGDIPENIPGGTGNDGQEDTDTVWAEEWNGTAAGGNSLTEQATLDQVVTSVGYEEVLPGISLQYITRGSSLKEYIVIRQIILCLIHHIKIGRF